MTKAKTKQVDICSSAAEYLTYVSSTGASSVEIRYKGENIWLTQKMPVQLKIAERKHD